MTDSLWGPDRMDEEAFLMALLRLMETESYHGVRIHTLHLDIVLPDGHSNNRNV